jgi:hypothetical protein
MKKHLVLAALSALSFYCGSAHAVTATVQIAQSNGAKQCVPGRITVTAMKRLLIDNGITVNSAACGNDGMMHTTVCGASTGEINIFTIPATSLNKAQTLGFAPLTDWPNAVTAPCQTEDLAPQTAVEVDINGIGPAVDAVAFAQVRLLIGGAVTQGTIEKFIVHGYGFEGGFSSCIEANSRSTNPRSFDALVSLLRAIRPNPTTTAYSVTPIASCH